MQAHRESLWMDFDMTRSSRKLEAEAGELWLLYNCWFGVCVACYFGLIDAIHTLFFLFKVVRNIKLLMPLHINGKTYTFVISWWWPHINWFRYGTAIQCLEQNCGHHCLIMYSLQTLIMFKWHDKKATCCEGHIDSQTEDCWQFSFERLTTTYIHFLN